MSYNLRTRGFPGVAPMERARPLRPSGRRCSPGSSLPPSRPRRIRSSTGSPAPPTEPSRRRGHRRRLGQPLRNDFRRRGQRLRHRLPARRCEQLRPDDPPCLLRPGRSPIRPPHSSPTPPATSTERPRRRTSPAIGTVFKLDAANNYALTTLHAFSGPDGASLDAAVIADASGNLYGTTLAGGLDRLRHRLQARRRQRLRADDPPRLRRPRRCSPGRAPRRRLGQPLRNDRRRRPRQLRQRSSSSTPPTATR